MKKILVAGIFFALLLSACTLPGGENMQGKLTSPTSSNKCQISSKTLFDNIDNSTTNSLKDAYTELQLPEYKNCFVELYLSDDTGYSSNFCKGKDLTFYNDGDFYSVECMNNIGDVSREAIIQHQVNLNPYTLTRYKDGGKFPVIDDHHFDKAKITVQNVM